jgi:OOP family OmpA-OmpF porin
MKYGERRNMNLGKPIISVFMLVCLMFIARTAASEIRSGVISLSPSIGGYVFDGNQDFDNGPAFGLGLGYNFDKHWAAEAAFNYVDTELDTDGSNVDTYLYHFDGLYHFMPSERLVPYIAAGLGGIVFDPENAKSDQYFAVNYGAGLKYFLSENVALRGDVRHVISFDETHSNLLYTAGFTFSFGGKKAKKAPVEALYKVEEKAVIMASEPKVEEKVVAAAAEPKIIILALEDVHFDFDQSTLTPEAQMILKRNIQLLKEHPKAQIRIAGYTSASGSKNYNQKLSERRAGVVQEYLINEGVITRDRLSKIGYGETNPAMHEAAPKEIYSEAAKANMRVLFEIIVK